jgi:hypothetical protein
MMQARWANVKAAQIHCPKSLQSALTGEAIKLTAQAESQ